MNRLRQRTGTVFAPGTGLKRLEPPPGSVFPPDDSVWCNKFEFESADSGKRYTISQHKEKRHWGCSCQGYRTKRRCKHLQELGLPTLETPFEVIFCGRATGAPNAGPVQAVLPAPASESVRTASLRQLSTVDDL